MHNTRKCKQKVTFAQLESSQTTTTTTKNNLKSSIRVSFLFDRCRSLGRRFTMPQKIHVQCDKKKKKPFVYTDDLFIICKILYNTAPIPWSSAQDEKYMYVLQSIRENGRNERIENAITEEKIFENLATYTENVLYSITVAFVVSYICKRCKGQREEQCITYMTTPSIRKAKAE